MEQAPKSPTPFDREAHKVTIERGLAFLQTVEEEYRAGTRKEHEIVFFAKKLQDLLSVVGEEISDPNPDVVANDSVSELMSGIHQDNSEGLRDYCMRLKSNLSTILATYRNRFNTQNEITLQAQSILQNEDARPSEILSTTQLLISQLYK